MTKCLYCGEEIGNSVSICPYCYKDVNEKRDLRSAILSAIKIGIIFACISIIFIMSKGVQYPILGMGGFIYNIMYRAISAFIIGAVIAYIAYYFFPLKANNIMGVIVIFLIVIVIVIAYIKPITSTELIAASTLTPQAIKAQSETTTRSPDSETPLWLQTDAVSDCVAWSTITPSDVGKEQCVYGTVLDAFGRDGAYFLTFSDDPEAFFLISYSDGWYEGVRGNCVMVTGEVKQLGRAPVIVMGPYDLHYCEE